MTNDLSQEGILKALKEGPWGRCVYRCDNNVVDHQVVNMEFENGANASFIMSGLTQSGTRRVQIMGTQGEIIGDMDKGSFTLYRYVSGEKVEIGCNVEGDGHGGGDDRMVSSFLRNVRQFDSNPSQGLTSATASCKSFDRIRVGTFEIERRSGGQAFGLAEERTNVCIRSNDTRKPLSK